LKLCALLSGGKDSNYALYKAFKEGHEISCIVVVKPRKEDSWLFHSVYPELAVLQAQSMGLQDKVYVVEVSGEKDLELIEFVEFMRRLRRIVEFDGIVSGAILSKYQLRRFDYVARSLGVQLYTPLWGLNQEIYLRNLVREGFIFIITKISTMGLPREFMLRPITSEHVEKIIELSRRYGFNPAFEGGEAETLVVDAPYFNYSLCLEGEVVSLSEFEHILKLSRYWLGAKGSECISIRIR